MHLHCGVGYPCRESSLQVLKNCTNWAVNRVLLASSAPWSEKFPPQVVHFPRRGSSGLENGLYHFSWETRSYELCPLRGHTHSFHNSGRGCRMAPPACERRSLLMGTSHGESSRREIRSENHTRPGQYGATNSRRTPSRRTLVRTPGSRAIGGKAYRRSLGMSVP